MIDYHVLLTVSLPYGLRLALLDPAQIHHLQMGLSEIGKASR